MLSAWAAKQSSVVLTKGVDLESLLNDGLLAGKSLHFPNTEKVVLGDGKGEGQESIVALDGSPLHDGQSAAVLDPDALELLLDGTQPAVKGERAKLDGLLCLVDGLGRLDDGQRVRGLD